MQYYSYASDTRSRHFHQTLVQFVWYQKLARVSVNLVQVFSGTSFLNAVEHSSVPAQKLSGT